MQVSLAPMAGYTDLPLRRMCRKFGLKHGTTALIDAGALVHGNRGNAEILHRGEEEIAHGYAESVNLTWKLAGPSDHQTVRQSGLGTWDLRLAETIRPSDRQTIGTIGPSDNRDLGLEAMNRQFHGLYHKINRRGGNILDEIDKR